MNATTVSRSTKSLITMPKFSENIHLMGDFGVSTASLVPSINTPKTAEGGFFQSEDLKDATPDQIDKLRKVMDAESQIAMQESMEIPDEDEARREEEENDRAAAEAAKDLTPDYEQDEEKEEAATEQLSTDGLGKVSDFGSVEKTLHTTSLTDLTSSDGALDNLIGASSALEMSDDNTEYLKRYSERVAMEADQSDEEQKQLLAVQDAEERESRQEEKDR